MRTISPTAAPSGIAAYTLLPDDKGDGNADKEILKAAGVDAVVVMRIVSKDKQVTYNPGSAPSYYYGGFGPYYSYGYRRGLLSRPRSPRTPWSRWKRWSTRSRTTSCCGRVTSRATNPDNMSALVDEVADAIAKEVAKG